MKWHASMVELVDTLDSKSCGRKTVSVRVRLLVFFNALINCYGPISGLFFFINKRYFLSVYCAKNRETSQANYKNCEGFQKKLSLGIQIKINVIR